jgi:PhnB protein
MATVGTYLNFARNTEEAFHFYKSVFGGDFVGGISRFGDIPPSDDMPPMLESDKNLVMHIALPILGGHLLMGTDAPETMGFKVNIGNNSYISLHLDTREEARQLFKALSKGGVVETELQVMFWGDYYGSFTDKFGVCWMVSCAQKEE